MTMKGCDIVEAGDRKAYVFIGSSWESQQIAKHVADSLQDVAEVQTWYDGFFKPGKSSFESLCTQIAAFDFAVFIGSGDDWTRMRKRIFASVRDNVLFEYGLFTGAIGRERTFLLMEDQVKVASDLNGITLLRYSLKNPDSLDRQCGLLKEYMDEERKLARISLLPSTSSAASYYINFLHPLCTAIHEEKDCVIDGVSRQLSPHTDRVRVLLPDTLSKDTDSLSGAYMRGKGYRPVSIGRAGGRRNLTAYGTIRDGGLLLADIPTCLSSLFKSIQLFVGKDFMGRSAFERRMSAREIDNFRNTLLAQLEEYPHFRGMTEVRLLEDDFSSAGKPVIQGFYKEEGSLSEALR